MNGELRRHVVIEPGGIARIQSDELPAGAEADVIVRVRRPALPGHYAALFGSGRGGFATPEEAVAFLRRERDGWKD